MAKLSIRIAMYAWSGRIIASSVFQVFRCLVAICPHHAEIIFARHGHSEAEGLDYCEAIIVFELPARYDVLNPSG